MSKSLTVKVRGEVKGCKSQSAFLSLCQKLALSRGGPSGKSAGGRPPESAGLQHISRGWLKYISGGWLKYMSSGCLQYISFTILYELVAVFTTKARYLWATVIDIPRVWDNFSHILRFISPDRPKCDSDIHPRTFSFAHVAQFTSYLFQFISEV